MEGREAHARQLMAGGPSPAADARWALPGKGRRNILVVELSSGPLVCHFAAVFTQGT